MTTSVFMADPRHNYSGVMANDCMPIGVGYLKAVMDRDLPEVDSRIFAYPDHILREIEGNPPDVLMLSNYMWCEQLSFGIARAMKQLRPETLVVMGGPNIMLEDERKLDYVRQHPEIDVYVLGEGDFLATSIAQAFLDAGKSIEKMRQRELPSSLHNKGGGEIEITPMRARARGLDEIPSPWLTGVMDPFFDGKLAPLLETNRGCPFTCTFCVQGTRWYSKVHYFDQDRLCEEIDYIAKAIDRLSPGMGTLRIADSNYGMYKRDTELSRAIGVAQRDYGWPTFIDATTGKNKPERIIESLEEVNGALVLYQAAQSLDDEVLKNVKRQTIKKDAYDEIMIHVRGRGLRSLSDLILGLPGESLDTHVRAIHELIDAGTHEMHNFQSMMLKGSELEKLESRLKYDFTTRFRVLPKNFGVYGGEKLFDVDEIIVATDSLPFEHYVEARIYHVATSLLWNNSWFEALVRFSNAWGLKSSAWLDAMVQGIKNDTGPMGDLLDLFVTQTKNELFETEEACHEFYARDENFERLKTGEIGDNLMYGYRARASFFLWRELCEFALSTTRKLLDDAQVPAQIAHFDAFWADLSAYIELTHAHGSTLQELLSTRSAVLDYDIAAWLQAGAPGDPSPFRNDVPRQAEFALPVDARKELEDGIGVWTMSQIGLSKGIVRMRSSVLTLEHRWTDD